MSVAAWLGRLGLECYEQVFTAHDIDEQTLPLLTETDLTEIGVQSVGHRRKLLEAIAALAQDSGPVLEPHAQQARALEAEHRQLTVLYCEMSRAGAPSSQMQAEQVRETIQSFHQTCTRVVAAFDGHVANFYGDCLLAYFGWPRAHEDDAERAVRAGLELVRTIRRLGEPDGAVSACAGIATGDVIVGDLIHHGPAREQSAVGLAPNLGARLLTLAPPGCVVMDELTKQLLPASFALQPLGRRVVKGLREPVAAYVVDSEQLTDSRFDAQQGQDLAPMIGRDQELGLLRERWMLACGAEGQAVLLVGEAGIGKSRLVRALLDACGPQSHGVVRWQCSPYHTGSALWPVIQQLSRMAGLHARDSVEQALDKLERLTIGRHADAPALCATLLGLDATLRYGPLAMTPQTLRERTLELLLELLLAMARERPMLLVVEDAHWIDPTTLELVNRGLERITHARMLILVTSRPDRQPLLGAHPDVTRLSLNRLSSANAQAIAARLGGGALNPQTLATIVAQTDGVPLFVEELTKAVLETGEAAIPASLHGSLMARLDRVPEVKEVAQIAACIGREFDEALLREVAEPPQAVTMALDKLAQAELIFRRGERRYTFKHGLVQEAAYESLLRGKRQLLHGRILQVLEAGRHDAPPEIRAHHAQRALQVDKAIEYWSEAGRGALAKSAYLEAIRFFHSAIEQIQKRTDSPERRMQESELQLRLGQARIAAEGYATQATQEAFMRAEELFEPAPGRTPHGLQVQYGLWAWHVSRGELKEALPIASRAIAAAQADGADEAILYSLRMVSASHLYLGELGRARACFEQAMPLLAANRVELSAQYGADAELALLHYFAWLLCLQGFAEQSKRLIEQACAVDSVGSLNTRALMHLFRFIRAACLRDRAALKNEAQAFAELAGGHRLHLLQGYADVLRGWVALDAGVPVDEVLASHDRALGRIARAGSHLFVPFLAASFAQELAERGRHDDAMRSIEQASAPAGSEGWCAAELWRLRGEIVLREPHGDWQAAGFFERALSIASAQGAKLWQLRAAMSMARLRMRQGAPELALDVLAPIYDRFTEGFDTVDLVEARMLLSECGTQRLPVSRR